VCHPALRGRPLGVLGNNGACVIARTAELKAACIRVGDPAWQARVKCPDAIFLKRDRDWLGDVSGRMLEVIRALSPTAEYFSVDEMGFEPEPVRGSNLRTAEEVRARIKERVGVPTTTGIARTRTLAKLVCDDSKPFSAAAVLTRAEEEALLALQPVTELCGIGPRRAATLARCGITTCLEFARANPFLLRRLLTVVSWAIHCEVNGEAVLPLKEKRPRHKLLKRGGSLGREVADTDMILGWMVRNLERRVEELRSHRLRAGRIALLVFYRKGRERLRRAALAHRPWEHATGPRTAAGNARSAANGKVRQKGLTLVRERRSALRAIRLLRRAMQLMRERLAAVSSGPDRAG
jgi:nucleotidyltransferase/DNA polymerase involved in DNA repair